MNSEKAVKKKSDNIFLSKTFKYMILDWRRFIAITVLFTLSNLARLGTAMIYGELINQVSLGVDIKKLLVYIGLTVGYTLFVAFYNWYFQYFFDYYEKRGMASLRRAYMMSVVNAQYQNVKKYDSARYMNDLTNEIPSLINVFVDNIAYSISCVIMVISSFAFAMGLNWKIAVTMVGFTLVMAILPLFIKKPLDKISLKESNARNDYMAKLKEHLMGISIIKTFGAEKRCAANVDDENNKLLKINRKKAVINSFASGLGGMVQAIAVTVLIAMTCYLVWTKEVLVGSVLSIFSIGNQFYGSILSLSAVFTYVMGYMGVFRKIQSIVEWDNTPDPKEALTFNDNIEFSGVSFSYADDSRKIIDNVSLQLDKNKKYLVLGKSGSGKSTLLKLMAKYYDTYEGDIIIDGVNYMELTDKQIATVMSVSQQDCYLFNTTMRENIDFLGEKDDEKLDRIIELTALDEFVSMLPEGLDTVVNEEINQVSGGEKLRINLARALYRESQILLLDEVTSALDKKTAEYVENNLLSLEDKTLVNVCHKFNDSTLPNYDKILIIENGSIVRSGSYSELENDEKLGQYRNKA